MKNNILFYFLSFLLPSLLLSCSSEDFSSSDNTTSNLISFEVSMPASEMRTRAFSDGSQISELYCYVYQKNATSPLMTLPVEIKSTDGKKGGSLDLSLPSGGVYDFVFVATSGPQNNSASKIYYDSNARTLAVNYDKISTNDEDVDCFLGVLKDISIAKGVSHKVTLKRPFAQLNIGTKDLDTYNTLSSSSLQKVGVSIDGVYSSMNVMDGSIIGNPMKATLAASTIPTGQTYPVNGAKYLSMNYLLVNTRKNVNVTMTASNASSSFDVDFADIPVQRNYQTNIYGNLLTKANDFKVEINPEFDGSGLKDVDDPWAEYDLVLKISTEHSGNSGINLRATTSDGKTQSINLTPFKDSQNYIKLNWNDLGLTNVDNIRFPTSSGKSSNFISEFLKCNIEKLGITDLSYLLDGSTHLTKATAMSEWDTSSITNMRGMFYNCENLVSLDLSNFDTRNVTNMSGMFYYCRNLSALDLSNFNTENVVTMKNMFYRCSRLTSLSLSNLGNMNVTDMSSMFESCYSLTSLNLENFGTQNVTTMASMFYGCSGLMSLDLSSFNTENVTTMAGMFSGCSGLRSLNLSSFDPKNVTSMASMFSGCSGLRSLNLSSFDTSVKVTTMKNMFYGCKFLASLDLSSFDTRNVTTMENMFYGCTVLSALDLTSFDTANVTTMENMFYGCKNLVSLNLSSFDTENVTTMQGMFYECGFSTIDLSNFNTRNVTNMVGMFSGCKNLFLLDLTSFNTRSVTNMSSMFYNCQDLENPDLSSFNTENVTAMEAMFYGCSGLMSLDLSSFNTENVTTMKFMFCGCSLLLSLDLSNFNTANVTTMSYMFSDCKKLTSLDLSSFDTQNVTSMENMFANCSGLTSLDLSSFNTENLKNMSCMFNGCTSLTFLDLSSFDTRNVTSKSSVFYLCNATVIWGPNGGL